jgi:hypothetical protein
VGYQEIDCHMIFDIKMDLTRKARFVAGGHTTETPTSITQCCQPGQRAYCFLDCRVE